MSIADLLHQTLRNLSSHKRRNFFSAFGVTWGVAAVLLLAGWGVSVQHYMREGMEAFGKDIIVVFPGHTSKGIGGYRAGRPIPLFLEDVEAIRAYSSSTKLVIPVDQYYPTVSRGNISEAHTVRGVVPDARIMRNLTPERGRFFTSDDMENRRRVCVIGPKIRDEYFKTYEDPLGKTLKIKGVSFTIIGILPEKQQMVNIGPRDEQLIFIPFSTGRRLFGRRYLFCIMAKSFQPEQDEQTVVEIRKALAIKHNFAPDDEEAVWIIPLTRYTKQTESFAKAVGVFVAGVGILTLAIGSIAITNMMLVSVSERVQEIGIRRAAGATRGNLLWQFLTETLILTSIAGAVGFMLGFALLWLIGRLPIPDYIPTPVVSLKVAIVAAITMVIAGIVAGITPARRAATIPPVDAIKGNVRAWIPKIKTSRMRLILPGIVGEILSQATQDIRTARMRAALTGFGVFWGIAAVALLVGWGTAMRDQMQSQIDKLGGRRTVLYPRRIKSKIACAKRNSLLRFTERDIEDLRCNAWFIEYLSPEISPGFPVIEYGSVARAFHTLGVDPDARIIRNFSMAKGRFINERDIAEKRKICVLGASAKQKIFASTDALGKTVRIDGIPFLVVGVMAAKGEQTSIETSLDDEKVLIPYTTASIITGRRYPDRLVLHPTTSVPYEEIEERVKKMILENHDLEDEDAIGMYSALEAKEEISKIMLGLTAFLGAVGLITLLVGAVGVANIMFVSVAQRTREIGIRRAVGAKRTHILTQFLFEAVLICVAAGILGALFATGVASLLGVAKLPLFFAAPRIEGSVILVIAAAIIGAGIVSGLFPARKAALVNVTESLRYE